MVIPSNDISELKSTGGRSSKSLSKIRSKKRRKPSVNRHKELGLISSDYTCVRNKTTVDLAQNQLKNNTNE